MYSRAYLPLKAECVCEEHKRETKAHAKFTDPISSQQEGEKGEEEGKGIYSMRIRASFSHPTRQKYKNLFIQ